MSHNVKSAVRVIRVLEYFDRIRRPASVTEIAQALAFPPSSTNGLLQSMLSVGYLVQDEQRRYWPTPRVTLLGAWVDPMLVPEGPILKMMDELSQATGEAIMLGAPSGIRVRYLHVVQPTRPSRRHAGPGDERPLAVSGIGRLFLSQMKDEEVRQVLLRHNAAEQDPAKIVSYAAVRRDIAFIRESGYASSTDQLFQGSGVVCVPLPQQLGHRPIALAMGGASQSIRARAPQTAHLMYEVMRAHLHGEAMASQPLNTTSGDRALSRQ